MEENKVVAFVGPPGYQTPPLENVIEMLRLDPEGAGNLFARIAKKHFSSMLPPHTFQVDEQVLAHPTWVEQQSVCLNLDAEQPAELAEMIYRVINRVASTVEAENAPSRKVVLIGALDVRLHALGKGFFNFVLKQKFTVGRDEQP